MMRSGVNTCEKNRDDKRNVLYSWAVGVRGGGLGNAVSIEAE